MSHDPSWWWQPGARGSEADIWGPEGPAGGSARTARKGVDSRWKQAFRQQVNAQERPAYRSGSANSHIDDKILEKKMKKAKKRSDWKSSLALVLKANGRTKCDGSVASAATQDKRADVLYAGFSKLRDLGYKLDDAQQFAGRHMGALAKAWERDGLSASTIQNSISIFRIFAGWIGKDGMIRSAKTYVSTAAIVSRSGIAKEDKSWSGRGVDIMKKIAEVAMIDPRVAVQLELELLFGLRPREAMQLRPYGADKGTYLVVNFGTKGGRARVVPIVTDQQRDLLRRAKLLADKNCSTSDQSKSLVQWKNHYYHVLRRVEITRKNGFTSHGLRHERLNEIYREQTGSLSPVQGGSKSAVSRADDKAARQEVAEVAGHSRSSVSSAYLGRWKPGDK